MWHPFTSWLWWMPNNLHIPAELRLDPMLPTSRVALVDPQMPDARKLLVSAFQQQRHGSAILNIRRVHPGSKYQATRIDEDMAFAPIDTFGPVVAADAADTSGSNRLAVDDASTRFRVASSTRAELLAEDSVQVLPRAIQTPQSEVVIGGLPGWELMRQQPPSTARPHHVEDGVQDLANGVKPRSAQKLWRRKKRVNTSKFSVRQVGQVRSPKGQTPAILPAKPTRVPVFRQLIMAGAATSGG
jgi:hypothetical protein